MYDNAIRLLKDIIAFNTVNPPGNERELAQYIAGVAHSMGLKVEVDAMNEARANVLIHIPGKDASAPSLMLNGHMDVVPVTREWHSNPFTLSEREDKLYGLGTCDMKGSIACMLEAVQQLLDEKFEFCGDLYLLFVADEECNNLGAKHFISKKCKVHYCIIGEPTMLKVCTAHRGVCRHKVIIEGRSCHASNPDNGINAVEKMAAFVLEISKLNKRLKAVKHPILTASTVAVTTIKGGEKHNIIPDYCEAVLDWRTLPMETEQLVHSELTRILDGLSNNGQVFQYCIEPVIYLNAGYMETGDMLVKKVAKAYGKCFGKEAVIESFPACGEQSLFIQAGIKTIFCGPGSIDQAHTANEYVETQQIKDAIIFYKEIIREILGDS